MSKPASEQMLNNSREAGLHERRSKTLLLSLVPLSVASDGENRYREISLFLLPLISLCLARVHHPLSRATLFGSGERQ
jgi:hypothetical protein